MYRNIVAFIVGMTALPLFAQQTDVPGRALSYDEAVSMVMENNDQIRADRYAEQASIKQKKAAVGLRSPQLSLSAGYAFMSDDIAVDMNGLKAPVGGALGQLGLPIPPALTGQLMAADWSLPLQERDFAVVGATLKVPIYTGGKINAANRAARIGVEQSRWQSAGNRNGLYTTLAERYYGLSLAMHVVDVRRQVVEGMKKHLDDAIRLEENGMIARVERLYAEMKLSEAQAELGKAQAEASTVSAALSGTIGTADKIIPVTSMFVLSSLGDVADFKALAVDNSPILKQVSMKRSLAEEAVKAHRAEFIPQIAAMGGINIYDYQLTKMAPRWAVGAGLSFNIFNGLSREHKFSAAKSTVKQVEAIEDRVSVDVNTLIDKLYNGLSTVSEQIDANDATIAFAEEYLRIKEKAFVEGNATSSDVVDARLNLAAAKIARLKCAYDFDVQFAQLLETCGVSERFADYRSAHGYRAID
ncbi:MAG: TolC family protein [Rikenellaceae bacterium]|nr:TolC family protein [Rikenellaceae bacterium]